MDFSRLSRDDLIDFLHKHRQLSDTIVNSINISQAGLLWNRLISSDDFELSRDLTPPVMDLYLSSQVQDNFPNESPYQLSDLLAATNDFLGQIGPILGLPVNPINQSDWEELRERVIRIIGFADLLVDDTFSVQPEDHANVWPVLFPENFDVNTGAINDTDSTTVKEYFPEKFEEAERLGKDFWEIYDPSEVATWDIRPSIIQRLRQQAQAEGKELKPGDIIDGGGYRNEHRYIFDGSTIIGLDYSIDDYGTLPLQFKFPEFPLNYWYVPSFPSAESTVESINQKDHWDYSIDHNKIQWIDLPRFEAELIRNLRGPVQFKVFDRPSNRTYLTYQGKKYNFEVDLSKTGQPKFKHGLVLYQPSGYFNFGVF